jgi:peptidoglycan/LPS O-acetylase OafA/YrhL
LEAFLWAIVLIGFLSRIGLAASGVDYLIVKKLSITCFDAMALGGIVAYRTINPCTHFKWFSLNRIFHVSFYIGTVLFIISITSLHIEGKGFIYTSFAHTSFALLSVALILPVIQGGYKNRFGYLLNSAPFQFLGMISYGCYLFHLHAARMSEKLLISVGLDTDEFLVLVFLCNIFVTVVIASISWYLFEKPINSLKRYFPMNKFIKQ